MPKSQMALTMKWWSLRTTWEEPLRWRWMAMAPWCLRTTWEQPLRWRWTKRWQRCCTRRRVAASTSPEHLTSWWRFAAGMTPAFLGLGRSKTARRFVHRRVSGPSALRSLISCKRNRMRWNENIPCCRNGRREWKRHVGKYAGWVRVSSAFCSPAQHCSWASWCYWRGGTPKTRIAHCCCAGHWCCRCFFCASAALLFRLLVSAVQIHDGKSWQLMASTAVSSWAALLWP